MNTEQIQPAISVEARTEDPARMVLALGGRLDSRTVSEAWGLVVTPVRQARPSRPVVNAGNLSYCDGAGLGLFAELRRLVTSFGGEIEFEGLSPGLQRLLDASMLEDPLARQLLPAGRESFVIYVGRVTWLTLQDLGRLISFVGELTAALCWAVRHPFRVRGWDVLQIVEKAGAEAMPVTCIIGITVGVILAFPRANPLKDLGAEPFIPAIVAVAVVREMAPLITAIILAGRSGSAFAAEIGTMKITEEVSALKTMGLDPMHFLAVPRVLAALVVMPLLTLLNALMSLFGGYVVMFGLGYSLRFYVNTARDALDVGDLLGGLFKTLVFAVIVAGVGCLRGLDTRSGPGAVGDSTTRAVVTGVVLTFAADAVFALVYYYLEI